MCLAELVISDKVGFESFSDKLFKLKHWNEPIDYQNKGLGNYLLGYIIELAKSKGVKKNHGSLTSQDIDNNPNLVHWYQKYGFKLESSTAEETSTANYRICLYLD